MRKETCDSCGTQNHFVSQRKSYRCTKCHAPMDWRFRVTCENCKHANRILSTEQMISCCSKCDQPLDWSINPEKHVANQIPRKTRAAALLFVAVFAGLSIKAIIDQRLTLPYGRYSRIKLEFLNAEIILPVVSLLMLAIGFGAMIADHYDRRRNEWLYRRIINVSLWSGIFLYFLSAFFGHSVG